MVYRVALLLVWQHAQGLTNLQLATLVNIHLPIPVLLGKPIPSVLSPLLHRLEKQRKPRPNSAERTRREIMDARRNTPDSRTRIPLLLKSPLFLLSLVG
jgi:hypothetical protein